MQSDTKKRILIVDDEEAILFSYKKILQGPFLEVDVCDSFLNALEMISSRDYNVVITDLRLSDSEGQEGLEVLRYVRNYNPSAAVLFLTGYGSDEIKEYVLANYNTYYFSKPLPVSELVEILRGFGLIVGRS